MNPSSRAARIKHNSIKGAGTDISGAHGRQEDALEPSLLFSVEDSAASTGYHEQEEDSTPGSGHVLPRMWA